MRNLWELLENVVTSFSGCIVISYKTENWG